jgi:hypothetical protein
VAAPGDAIFPPWHCLFCAPNHGWNIQGNIETTSPGVAALRLRHYGLADLPVLVRAGAVVPMKVRASDRRRPRSRRAMRSARGPPAS